MTWDWTIFLIGCSGGLIPDVLRIVQRRHEAELPAYMFSANFWIGLVLLVVIGGLAAVLAQAIDWKQALSIGYAGPEFLSRAFASKPITLAGGGALAVVRRWWPSSGFSFFLPGP
jgi:hypothetical protein